MSVSHVKATARIRYFSDECVNCWESARFRFRAGARLVARREGAQHAEEGDAQVAEQDGHPAAVLQTGVLLLLLLFALSSL